MSASSSKRKSISQIPAFSITNAKKLDQLPKAICRMRVKYDYEKENTDEIDLKKGHIIDVNQVDVDGDEGWARGFNLDTKMYGIFPMDFCTIIVSQIPKPQRSGQIYDASESFTPAENEDDCIELRRGEFVEVLPSIEQVQQDLADGYTKVFNFTSLKLGLVPTTHITKIEAGGLQQGATKRPRLSVYGASSGSLMSQNNNQVVDLTKTGQNDDFERLDGLKYFRIIARQTPEFDEDLDLVVGDFIQTSMKSKLEPLYYGCKVGTSLMGFIDIEICEPVSESEAKKSSSSSETNKTTTSSGITLRNQNKTNSTIVGSSDQTTSTSMTDDRQFNELKNRMETIECEIKNLSSKIETSNKSSSQAFTKNDDLEFSLNQTKTNVDDLKSKLDSIKNESDQLRTQIKEASEKSEKELHEMDMRVSTLDQDSQERFESVTRSMVSSLGDFEVKQNNDLDNRIKEIYCRLQELESNIRTCLDSSTNRSNMADNEDELRNRVIDFLRQSEDFVTLKNKYASINENLQSFTNETKILIDDMNRANSDQTDSMNIQIKSIQSKISNIESMINDIKNDQNDSIINDMIKRMDDMKNLFEQDQSKIHQLLNGIQKQVSDENEALKRDISSFKEDYVTKVDFENYGHNMDNRLDSKFAHIEPLDQSFKSITKRLDDIEIKFSSNICDKSSNDNINSTAQIQLENQINELSVKIDEIKSIRQNNNGDDDISCIVGRLEGEIKKLESKIKEESNDTLELVKKSQKKIIEELRRDVLGLNNEIKQLNDRMSNMTKSNESNKDKIVEDHMSNVNCEQLNHLQDATQQNNEKMRQIEDKLTHYDKKNEDQLNQIENLKKIIESYHENQKSNVIDNKDESGSVDQVNDMAKVTKAIKNLAEKVINIESDVSKLSENKVSSESLESLKELKDEFEKFKQDTNSNIKAFSRRVTSMKAQIQNLTEKQE